MVVTELQYNQKRWRPGVLTIYMEKPEILVEKSNGSWHSVWELYKIWAVIWGDKIFPLFLVFSADLDIICSGLFSQHIRFYSFMRMHKISPRVVCANSLHPRFFSCCLVQTIALSTLLWIRVVTKISSFRVHEIFMWAIEQLGSLLGCIYKSFVSYKNSQGSCFCSHGKFPATCLNDSPVWTQIYSLWT